MVLRGRGGSALGWLVAAAAVSAAVAAGSIDAGSDHGKALAPLQALLEAAFDAPLVLLPAARVPAVPDLNDGRSAVAGRWRHSIETFALDDRAHTPAAGGIVFIGSSSISQWSSLQAQFPSRNIVRRGLGGARMADCAHYADRLVLPYRPRLLVVYAGDNDLAEGVAPEAVLAAYVGLVQQVQRALPRTRIAFLSIKPSPSRELLIPAARRTNALIAAYTRTDARLAYIDVFTPMLDSEGRVRPELYRPDALHPNAAGYAIWKEAIGAHLD